MSSGDEAGKNEYGRAHEQEAVDSVEHAAVSWNDPSRIFLSSVAF